MTAPDAERLGHLMSGVAHDLRTPLATVYGFAKTIERGGGLDERQQRFLALIIDAAADMDRMIENVSTVGHVASGRMRLELAPVATGALVGAAHAAIPERADGRRVVADAGGGTIVETDAERVARALALVVEAALRLEPGRAEARIAADGTAVRMGPFSPELLAGLAANGRDVAVETARIVLAHAGVPLEVDGDDLVARFPPAGSI